MIILYMPDSGFVLTMLALKWFGKHYKDSRYKLGFAIKQESSLLSQLHHPITSLLSELKPESMGQHEQPISDMPILPIQTLTSACWLRKFPASAEAVYHVVAL